MDLALNNLQILISQETQPTNQPTNTSPLCPGMVAPDIAKNYTYTKLSCLN